MLLSIIIVNFNTKELLKDALLSISENPPEGEYEIIVVDNASQDGSRDFLKQAAIPCLRVIYSEENLGFSKANNVGAKQALGAYLLFLNPDTQVRAGTLTKCVRTLQQDQTIGALGCRVMLPDGSLDLACKRNLPTLKNSFFKFTGLAKLFPSSPFFSGYNLTYLPDDGEYDVGCLVGAFMCLPRDVFWKVGGFDEDYFMYGEDIDLCRQIKNAGLRIFYLGSCSILHVKRASSVKSPKAKEAFYNSMLIYYKKHASPAGYPIKLALVKLGVKIAKKFNL